MRFPWSAELMRRSSLYSEVCSFLFPFLDIKITLALSPFKCSVRLIKRFIVLWENSDPSIPPSNDILATTGMQLEASAQPPPSVPPGSTLSDSLGNHLSPMASMAEPASHGQNNFNTLQLSQSWIWNPTDFS